MLAHAAQQPSRKIFWIARHPNDGDTLLSQKVLDNCHRTHRLTSPAMLREKGPTSQCHASRIEVNSQADRSLLDPLQYRSSDQRQPNCSVQQYFRKSSAFFDWHKLAPGNRLAVGAAGKPSPVHGFRADSDAIVKALQNQLFSASTMSEINVRAELLRPIPRHAAADGEDAESFLFQQSFRIVFQIVEWIVAKRLLAIPSAYTVVHREIQTNLRITERRHKNWNTLFEG